MRDVIESHESIPWRRRAFEREAVLDRLCDVAGFPKDWQEDGVGAEEGEGGPESDEDLEELAGVPAAAGVKMFVFALTVPFNAGSILCFFLSFFCLLSCPLGNSDGLTLSFFCLFLFPSNVYPIQLIRNLLTMRVNSTIYSRYMTRNMSFLAAAT